MAGSLKVGTFSSSLPHAQQFSRSASNLHCAAATTPIYVRRRRGRGSERPSYEESEGVRGREGPNASHLPALPLFHYTMSALLSHNLSHLLSNKGAYFTILSPVQYFITFLFLQLNSKQLLYCYFGLKSAFRSTPTATTFGVSHQN